MLSMDTFEDCEVHLYDSRTVPEDDTEGKDQHIIGGLVFMCYQDALAILLEKEIGLHGPEKRFKLESLCLQDTRYAPKDPLRIKWELLSPEQHADILSILADVHTLRVPRIPIEELEESFLPLFHNVDFLSIYWSAPVDAEGALAYNSQVLEAVKRYRRADGGRLRTLQVMLPFGMAGSDGLLGELSKGLSLL